MSADLAGWLTHPVTLALGGVAAMLLFLVVEVLLRSLAEMENVRFQGIVDDHEKLLPGDTGLHLSRLVDVLRWLQILSIGLMWAIVFWFPRVSVVQGLAVAVLLPAGLVILSRTLIGALGEDAVTVLLRMVRPLVWPLLAVLVRLGPEIQVPVEDEEEEASDREIQAYLEAGQAAGIFESEEGEFVESLVDFFDTVAREVMTPRTDMVAVSDTVSFAELGETFAETRKSRIPVYSETVDRVVGVVHVKDLVSHAGRGSQPALSELCRECLVVPESKQLGELLRDFQQQHQQLAIVVDEYGGTSGLVTLEDILEEIVGEIQDEYDPKQPPEWQELSSGGYRIQARSPLEVLEELFDVEVDEDDIDTVGGLVFSRHGTVPEPGTEVADEALGLHFTVDEMDERRIVSVTVSRDAAATGEAE